MPKKRGGAVAARGGKADASKDRSVFDKWDEQKKNSHNEEIVRKLDFYNQNLRDQSANVFDYDGNKEFKQALVSVGSERNACALKCLKMDANTTQNRLALRPDDEDANIEFMDAQIELRDWRGSYIHQAMTLGHETLRGVTPGLSGGPLAGMATYEVLFSLQGVHTNDQEQPYRAYVSGTNTALENMTPKEMISIIKTVIISDEVIDSQVPSGSITPNAIVEVLGALEDQFRELSANSDYFIGAEAAFDRTARYAFKTGRVVSRLKTKTSAFGYRFNMNKMLPTKEKIYQNPKVVKKMIVDFLKYDVPAMHVDLTVDYGTDTDNKCVLVWTIHKLEHGTHVATNLTYISERDQGLVNLPATLPAIRKLEEATSHCYSCRVDPTHCTKHDDMGMLDLHAHLAGQHFRWLSANLPDRECHDEPIRYGFIYEYTPDYTIIASTSTKSTSTKCHHVTSYTIIHWNPNLHKKQRTQVTQPPTESFKLTEMEGALYRINVQIQKLNAGYDELSPYRYGLTAADIRPVELFIPGILEDMDYAKSAAHNPSKVMGGYVMARIDHRDRMLVEHHRHKLEIDLLRAILPALGKSGVKVYTELKNLVLEQFADAKGGRPAFIHAYPGFLGTLLMAVHKAGGYQSLIPHVKQWTLDWDEFLTSRKIPHPWSDSTRFTEINNKIEDRRSIKKQMDRKQYPGRALPNPRFTPNRYPKDQKKSIPTSHPWQPTPQTAADRNRSDMDAMGIGRPNRVRWDDEATRASQTRSEFENSDSTHSLKMQAEIDTLKRTLNALTLSALIEN